MQQNRREFLGAAAIPLVGITAVEASHPVDPKYQNINNLPELIGERNGRIKNWKELWKEARLNCEEVLIDCQAETRTIKIWVPENHSLCGDHCWGECELRMSLYVNDATLSYYLFPTTRSIIAIGVSRHTSYWLEDLT